MLALSSLSNSSRYVGILYAGVIFFTQAIYGVLCAVTRSTSLSWISFSANLDAGRRRDLPAAAASTTRRGRSRLLMIVGLIALSAFVLERRVRGVEVVA